MELGSKSEKIVTDVGLDLNGAISSHFYMVHKLPRGIGGLSLFKPLPSTWTRMGLGVIGLGVFARRRKIESFG